jgi:capsular polysaccharide biosynthesis protein
LWDHGGLPSEDPDKQLSAMKAGSAAGFKPRQEGLVVTLKEAVYVLRVRWITVAVVTVAATIIAAVWTTLAMPTYMGSTRIFVAIRNATTGTDAYEVGQLSQARVVSYRDLIMSEALTTRTVNRLKLNISPRDLAKKVSASAQTDSVVITLSATDSSATGAISLANALSEDFVSMVEDLETPPAGGPTAVRAVIVQPAVDAQWISPSRPKIIVFGVFVGLLLGSTVALLRGRPKRRDRREDGMDSERTNGTASSGHEGIISPIDPPRQRENPLLGGKPTPRRPS